MSKIFLYGMVLILGVSSAFAEQIGIENRIKNDVSVLAVQEKNFGWDSYYQNSAIKQGGRHIVWRTWSNRFAYFKEGLQAPYLEVTHYDRDHVRDDTIDLGYNGKIFGGWWRGGVGFSAGHLDFVYKFQASLGYEHRWVKNLFWKFDQRFLNYPENDVFISTPGLTYYFGNSYLTAEYGVAATESRGVANSGVLKGTFYVTRLLDVNLGVAVGERLYDIFDTIDKASQQYGTIFFGGVRFKMTPDIALRLGYSYSMEKPAFIKRSGDISLSIKF